MSVTYIVIGRDTGHPSLPDDSVVAGLNVGDTFSATLSPTVESELVGAGVIARYPIPSGSGISQATADAAYVHQDGTGLPVSVVSASPTGGVVPWVTGHVIPLNQLVSNAGLVYLCKTAHTAGGSFDATKFDAVGGGGFTLSSTTVPVSIPTGSLYWQYDATSGQLVALYGA